MERRGHAGPDIVAGGDRSSSPAPAGLGCRRPAPETRETIVCWRCRKPSRRKPSATACTEAVSALSAFPMGVTASGQAKGYAYWSVRCKNGKSYVVQIPPSAKRSGGRGRLPGAARHRQGMLQEVLRRAGPGSPAQRRAADRIPKAEILFPPMRVRAVLLDHRRRFGRSAGGGRRRTGTRRQKAAIRAAIPNLTGALPRIETRSRQEAPRSYRPAAATASLLVRAQLRQFQGEAAAGCGAARHRPRQSPPRPVTPAPADVKLPIRPAAA